MRQAARMQRKIEQVKADLSSSGRCAAEIQELQLVRSAALSLSMLELPAGLVPEADTQVVPLRRNKGFWVGAAAAVVALVIAVAALVTPSSPSIAIDELNSRYGARASLDPAFGPAKVIVPDLGAVLD